MNYDDYVASKLQIRRHPGLTPAPSPEWLAPFQADLARWANAARTQEGGLFAGRGAK